MAAKMRRCGFQLKSFLLLLWLSVHSGDGYSCPYGHNCVLEPAPPGKTPPCAQPGLTYCVHPDPYPEKIIRQLIEAGQYDISTLLSDETRDEFSLKKNDYPYDYGPNSLPHVDQISLVNDPHYQKNYNTKFHTRYNHDIFAQKTPLQPPTASDPTPYNINAYQASNFSKFGFHGYSPNAYGGWNPTRNFGDYDKKVLRQNPFNQNFFDPSNFYPNYESNEWFRPSSGVSQYNPNEWWKYVSPSRSDVTIERSVTFPTRTSTARRRKRNAELVKVAEKRKLTGAEALRIALGLANEDTSGERHRRQAAAPNTQTLCSVRTEFITPRAALNNKGNWKYVVNMPDNMSQLVRAEICTPVSPPRSDVTIERSITLPTRTLRARRRKRNAELVQAAKKRKLTGAEALRIALGHVNEDTSVERHRRQSAKPNTVTLCSVRTMLINPRAAQNKDGNWKYVANMPDSMSQLVRVEICDSSTCSGLCSVPLGYSSSCEQKYIQKRLVALQPSGQNLYTDVFWIPSCCQCTFKAN